MWFRPLFVQSPQTSCNQSVHGSQQAKNTHRYYLSPLIAIKQPFNCWIRSNSSRSYQQTLMLLPGGTRILVYVTPKGRVFAPFWSENGYRVCPFWSGIGFGLGRNYGCVSMCSSFQFQMNKKLKETVICEFEMSFKKSFCCGFNLSNDDIIYVNTQCCVL